MHSANIEENSNVALVIYDSTVPEGDGFGVYISGKASVVNDVSEIKKAMKLIYQRKQRPVPQAGEFAGDSLRKVYKAVPISVWVNDLRKKSEELKYLRVEIRLK